MSVTHWRPETSRSGCAKRIALSTGNPSITHADSIDPPSPRNLKLLKREVGVAAMPARGVNQRPTTATRSSTDLIGSRRTRFA